MQHEAASSSSLNGKLWQKIWRLQAPPKVRVFIWRLCNKALPTCKGLHSRIESISSCCFRCNKEEESEFHAIWGCPFAANVWEYSCLESLWDNLKIGKVVDILEWCFDNLRACLD